MFVQSEKCNWNWLFFYIVAVEFEQILVDMEMSFKWKMGSQ